MKDRLDVDQVFDLRAEHERLSAALRDIKQRVEMNSWPMLKKADIQNAMKGIGEVATRALARVK